MSRIDQLSIQGIRNFSSDSAEVIRFEPPVTLILGKNGSGKTVSHLNNQYHLIHYFCNHIDNILLSVFHSILDYH